MSTIYQKIANLTPEKRELLELMLKEQDVELSKKIIVPQKRDKNQFPLSFSQQRLWFLDQFEPGSPVYTIPAAVQLSGKLNVVALERCLNEIIARHEVLRTTFTTVNNQPVQVIAPSLTLTIPITDLGDIPVEQRWHVAMELAVAEFRRSFDLSKGPLLRATLVKLAEEEHLVLLAMHHIVSDGWSTGIFIREIAMLYSAYTSNRSVELPGLKIQYADFAVWQRQWLQDRVLEEQLNYWKKQLEDCFPVLELTTDRPRPAVQTYNGSLQIFFLDKALAGALNDLARQEGATIFMVLLAAFQILLYRYSDQKDINIGTPIANRNRSETTDIIGFFINTLVLRTDLSGNPTFRELLKRVKEVTLNAYVHQDLPFEILVEELQPERDMSHTPFFQVMFVLNNAPIDVLELPGIKMKPLEIDTGTAKFDLVLSMMELADGFEGKLEYNTDLYEPASIRQMLDHFNMILKSITSNADERIADLSILTAEEEHKILVDWNKIEDCNYAEQCFQHLFEAQVERTPDATAVVMDQKRVTYNELNLAANQLAHYLQKLGVEPEMPVGIFADRSIELIIGLLGILKAGGAYVPLDPAYPKERLAFILDDAGIPVLLTQQKFVQELPEHKARLVYLDTDLEKIAAETTTNPVNSVSPHNLAYVIYTSGSTGVPKGVLVNHSTISNHCQEVKVYYQLSADDRVLQFAPLNFDASIEQILPTLITGATLVMRDPEIWSPLEFHQKVKEFDLTVINLPTAYWQQLAYEWYKAPELVPKGHLRLVIIGGDKLSLEGLRLWQQTRMNSVRMLNAYGPTETTITATTFEIPPDFTQKTTRSNVPIGRPLGNRKAYVLDKRGRPVPIGVPGELCVGGPRLARGYLNRPEQTTACFVPDPFSENSGARLYKTGDLVRYLADGTIEFLGRVDYQVKIRGFRIEPGEIEAVLEQHPAIKETVVIARDDTPGDKQLTAYLICSDGSVNTPATMELRSFLQEKLPDYMVPSNFVFLESMPLTPSGKLDRKALPEPGKKRLDLKESYVAPRTPVEQMLAELWQEIIGVERIGIYDNFFELGGHSLMATRIASRLREMFRVELPLRKLFEAPTIEKLAILIAETQAEQIEEDQMDELLAELEDISNDEVEKLLSQEMEQDQDGELKVGD